jgi:glyoxylase-like metal-dependent hydrolase (beta-lactamase superfamily II)
MTVIPQAPEITAHELAEAFESGVPMQVLDVRAAHRVAAGSIDLAPPGRFHNIVASQVSAMTSLEGTGIERAMPIAVVCGHGNDSAPSAHHLIELGYDARTLAGGMAAWTMLVLARELAPIPGLDRLIQFDRIGKGALGYVLVSDGAALIVDPPRQAEAYLQVVGESGARVIGVADTHVHADYISGAAALSRMLEVPYYLHPADAVYPYDGTPGRIEFRAVTDGDTIPVGRATVRVRHTPGHTEGSVTYLIDGAAALTGDFIFIGALGRPDLVGKTRAWTADLWNSVAAAKREWADDLMILPAHYGSESERHPDRSVGERFGVLLSTNDALAIGDRDAFMDWVERKSAPAPEAYRTIKAVNVGLRPVSQAEAEELEVGRNECALGRP